MNSTALALIITASVIVGIILLAVLLRWFIQGGKYRKQNKIDGKVVIVTGANTGIGKETALELAKRGAIVYMACRDMIKAEEACSEIQQQTGNMKVYCRKLDLSSLESVREFAQNFISEQSRLDILVNNAGIMHCPLMRTEEGFEMQLGVNHMGHFLLTNLLLDLLKQSKPSRIVVVSSALHTSGEINVNDLNSEKSYSKFKAYSQSKLANVLFAHELSRKLTGTGVTVNALHPGVVNTELGRHWAVLNNWFGRILLWPFLKTPKNGAQTTLYAALDTDLELVSGLYFSDCKPKKPSRRAKDDAMAKWLWNESAKWTKIAA